MDYEARDGEALSHDTLVADFAAEREMIKEKHRLEVLNLLKSFEFEKRNMESRFRAELDQARSEGTVRHGDEGKSGVYQNELHELMDKLKRVEDEQQKPYDEKNGDSPAKIKELEEEVVVRRGGLEDVDKKSNMSSFGCDSGHLGRLVGKQEETDSYLSWKAEGPTQELVESEAGVLILKCSDLRKDELPVEGSILMSVESSQKSMNELQVENQRMEEELDAQRKKVLELQVLVDELSRKVNEIQEVVEDQNVSVIDVKQRIREVICPSEPKDRSTAIKKKHSIHEGENVSKSLQQHQSTSEMSFQIDELNLENEELKSSIREMEHKIHRTVNEYEMQRTVFKEKLEIFQEKLEGIVEQLEQGDLSSQVSKCARDVLENTVDELRGLTLVKTTKELLDNYIDIFLQRQSDPKSPDVFDVNLRHEIHSLEQLLDIEIFDGRVFDKEMKDEVKQVLRDKERELIVAYALENLRAEIRHRVTMESIQEELRKEREKTFNISEAATEVLMKHLGMSSNVESTDKELEKALLQYSQEEPKSLEEQTDQGMSSAEIEALKTEKEQLEIALEELQDCYNKERQDWLNQLQCPYQDNSEEVNCGETLNENHKAQNCLLEQVLNAERFYLSRLYYAEMKEELEVSLKQYQFQRSGKNEQERLTEAWRHQAAVGELYQNILDKENEDIERMKERIRDSGTESENGTSYDVSSEDMLKKEISRLQLQLPVKLELVELQRKRCGEHITATLILEQAVNAVETAVQSHDALLVSSDYFHRKSSWTSSDEDYENADIPEWGSLGYRSPRPVHDGKDEEIDAHGDLCDDSINSKGALRKALIRIFRKLIHEQTGAKETEPDSCSSDSDLSEPESITRQDIPDEDELPVKKDFETGDVLSDGSPEGSPSEIETNTGRECEENHQLNDATSQSPVPQIFKLSPEIENFLNIERINMSRVLREEYIDKIRRGRQKLRVIQAQKYENNEELLTRFQEYVGLLLERIDFGDQEEGREAVSPKRRKLAPTPSDDSGIADFVDTDRDEVIRKYKELLEKARTDLNHAHKALKKRPRRMEEDKMGNDFVAMKRNLKEKANDLRELQSKLTALESEREELLHKIRGTMNPTNVLGSDSETNISGEIYYEAPEQTQEFDSQFLTELNSSTNGQSSKTKFIPNTDDGEKPHVASKAVVLQDELENRKELDSEIAPHKSFASRAGNEKIGVSRRLLSNENDELKRKVHELKKELEIKDMKFHDENRRKQEEVEELQQKIMDGTGEEDLLRDLQQKLNKAVEEKRKLQARCSEFEKREKVVSGDNESKLKEDLEKELERVKAENVILEKENALKQEKVHEFQTKLEEGSAGNEIVKNLQHEIKELYTKNKMLENKCNVLEEETVLEGKRRLSQDNMTRTITGTERDREAMRNENQEKTDEIENIQKDLSAGSETEDIFKELQNKLKNSNDTNKMSEKKYSDAEQDEERSTDDWEKDISKLNRKEQKLILDNKSKEDKMTGIQEKVLEGSRGEELFNRVQHEERKFTGENESLEALDKNLGVNGKLRNEKEKGQLEAAILMNREENAREVDRNSSKDSEVRELQNTSIRCGGGEDVLLKLQDKVKENQGNNTALGKMCRDLKDTCERLENRENLLTNENREMAREVAKLRKEVNDFELESQTKTAEITKLQEKLFRGTEGKEILQELQNQVKELETMNKDLRNKCRKAEDYEETFKDNGDEVNNKMEIQSNKIENKRLAMDNKSREAEKPNLHKKLQEVKRRDVTENVPGQFKKVRENDEKLEAGCQYLADESKKLTNDKRKTEEKSHEVSGLREGNADLADDSHSKDSEVREVQKVTVDDSKREENKNKGKELDKSRSENKRLVQDNKNKEAQTYDLQKKLEESAQRKNLLKNVPIQLTKEKENDEELEADYRDLEEENESPTDKSERKKTKDEISALRELNTDLTNQIKSKDHEIRELQKALVKGSGGEKILKKLHEKDSELKENNRALEEQCRDLDRANGILRKEQNDLMNENKETAIEVARITKEKDYLERENQAKTDAIRKLQEMLLDGTGNEEILHVIQNKVQGLEELKKDLRKKSNDMAEDDKEPFKANNHKANEEIEKELVKLKSENVRLVHDNKSKEEHKYDLQKKLQEGAERKDVLENVQKKLKKDRGINEILKDHCREVEEEHEKLRDGKSERKERKDEISTLRKLNSDLTDQNKSNDGEIRKLETTLVEGNEGEKILQKLREKISKLEENNRAQEEQLRDLDGANDILRKTQSDLTNENKEIATEVARITKESDYLERESQAKTDEIMKLQEKLLDGSGGEEILHELQNQVKELEGINKDLRKRCNEMGYLEEKFKDNEEQEIEKKSEKKIEINNISLREKGELQKKALGDTEVELGNRQDQVKTSMEENNKLQIDCRDLKDAKGRQKDAEENKQYDMAEISRLQETENLVAVNEIKSHETSDLQSMLVSATGGKGIVRRICGEFEMSKNKNDELQNQCNNLENTNEDRSDKNDGKLIRKIARLKNENVLLTNQNQAKTKEIHDMEELLAKGTGGQDILRKLRNKVQELEDANAKLEESSNSSENMKEMLKKSGIVSQEEIEKKSKRENEELSSKSEELKKQNRELENKCSKFGKEGNELLKREMAKMMVFNKELENEIKSKSKEINRIQKKLVEGSGSEEVVEELQDQVKILEERNRELEKALNGVENSEEPMKTDYYEEHSMNELDSVEKTLGNLENINEGQKDEIAKVQERLVGSIRNKRALEEMQEELKNSEKENNRLKALCEDLKTVVKRSRNQKIEEDEKPKSKLKKEREFEKLKKYAEMLELKNKMKEEEIFRLQKKLLEGTGGEKILQQFQNRLKDSEEKITALEIECSILDEARLDLRKENDLLKSRDTVRRNNTGAGAVSKSGTNTSATVMKKEGKNLFRRNDQRYQSLNGVEAGAEEECTVENILDGDNGDRNPDSSAKTSLSNTEREEMFPRILEERDHWKEMYKTLRRTVGEQFVDRIPEVLAGQEKLEKQRVETLSKLSDLRKEISELETPLLRTTAESKRVEMELSKVTCNLEDNVERLENIRNLHDQEERIKAEESRLRHCLEELESKGIDSDNLEESFNIERETFDHDDLMLAGNRNAREEKINQLYQEMKDSLVGLTSEASENKRRDKNAISAMFDEKLEMEREIKKLERAIEDLEHGSSAGPNITQPSSASWYPEDVGKPNYENSVIQDELEKISDEVSTLQSSLEASKLSSQHDVENLVALMKEKSKLEDELSDADKALNQLGKREYENLLKEREKQKKVAKRLLELSREKEVVQSEFEEIESLVKAKEREFLSYLTSEREKDELQAASFEKEVSKRKIGRGEVKAKDSEYVEDESAKDLSTEQKQLSTENSINMSEELGSMIQKKSSLAVRLESLGKEITTQSLKVEKSLVGVKEDPAAVVAQSPSYSSIDDLTQSQLSVFDDYNMIDELSLATRLVREERLKRKASKKAPMAKLLKEKAGLDKKMKELEGKILAQNTKIKNALREGKDAERPQEKFTRAIEERGRIKDELASVVSKIDECKRQSDETESKGKLGKRRASSGSLGKKAKSSQEKAGKPLSKNDKRRLLSQRESLEKQLESVKRRIEGFSLNGDDDGLENFPEMAEVGNVRKTVERLRELIIQEAKLKEKLEGIRSEEQSTSDEKPSGNSDSYPGLVNVLWTEKENKQTRLNDLENAMELEKRSNNTEKVEIDLSKKRKALKDKLQSALKELRLQKQVLRVPTSHTRSDKTNLEKEQLLMQNIDLLTRQKEQLEKKLSELQESLQTHAFGSNHDLELITEEYQQFAELENEEGRLRKALENINEQLFKRKEWHKELYDVGQEQPTNSQFTNGSTDNLADSYFEILKRMKDENLSMTDLILELEVTQETLSEEREITGELLNLIKSRVGNELLEALTGDVLSSSLIKTAEQNGTGAGEYQEVTNEVGRDSVTVAEIIANYKKMNSLAQQESQKFINMLELLRSKIDEDLFTCIVNEEPADLEVSKKFELSRILENNETLFQQIASGAKAEGENKSLREHVRFLEEEREKIKTEMNEQMRDKLARMNQELGNITAELNEVKRNKHERETESLVELKKDCLSSQERDDMGKENKTAISNFEDSRNRIEEIKNKTQYSKEDMELLKEGMEQQIREMNSKFDKVEKMKSEIESELKCVNEKRDSLAVELATMENEKNEAVSKLEQADKLNKQIAPQLDSCQMIKSERKLMEKKLVAMENEFDEIVSDLEVAKKVKNELENKLKSEQKVKEENKELKRKLAALEKDNKNITSKLQMAEKAISKVKKRETTGKNEAKVEDKPSQVMNNNVLGFNKEIKQDNMLIKEKIGQLERQNQEIVCNLDQAYQTNEIMKEESKVLRYLREENASMKQMLDDLEKENNEIIPTLEELKKANKDLEDEVEYLRKEKDDLESVEGNLSKTGHGGKHFKEELEYLKKEKDEIDHYLENVLQRNISGGIKKALEGINKDIRDMEEQNQVLARQCKSSKELKKMVGESLAEKLISLSKGTKDVLEDTHHIPRYVETILTNQITLARVLESYEKDLDMIEQCLGKELFGHIFKKDSEWGNTMKGKKTLRMLGQLKDEGSSDLTQIVKAYEDLIDSQAIALKNVERLSEKLKTKEAELESIREQKDQVEKELDGHQRKHIAKLVTALEHEPTHEDVELGHLDNGASNRESSKNPKQIRAGETQENIHDNSNDENYHEEAKGDLEEVKVKHGEKNEEKETIDLELNKEAILFQRHDLEQLDMEKEYQKLLIKVGEHQREIEEAEEVLREQRNQHELEKQRLVEHFNSEKNGMQHQIECERKSMAAAMQNLISEIVRLKEERKEIRKVNRLEREKMEIAFEKERAEIYSNNEVGNTEMQEKLEKVFLEASQKEKAEAEQMEKELKEEVLKLKREKMEMAVKLKEMERSLERELSLHKESSDFRDSKERQETREKIWSEFEEKLKQEKKNFQDTLTSLRQEIDRLQQERNRIFNEISEKRADTDNERTIDYSLYKLQTYAKIESDFKMKALALENHIKELRKEKEDLNKQKQEMKVNMRNQRLEMYKKHESEKEELAEKYRGELKLLRSKLHKKVKAEREVQEKDAKIIRYETFFRELNREASLFRQDPDMAV